MNNINWKVRLQNGAYHSLGGNGTITKIYNETMALPEEPKEDKK